MISSKDEQTPGRRLDQSFDLGICFEMQWPIKDIVPSAFACCGDPSGLH